ncbi:MAG: mannose-1-phosphate guanylyltransferase [Chloroflexota bacterium]|nr:MAG: mannose-1-phosphate guanylyltransferase [Chloroflexota bacterium]
MQYAVVMAGGAGTRLWPAARRDRPKQLQNLIFEQPLIAETVQRLRTMYDLDRIIVVTAKQYADAILEVVPDLPTGSIISEPVGRNTAAAIALAAFRIAREDPDNVFAVFPADHVILKPRALFSALDFAHSLALRHRVVDIGVPPSHPETGYGYIELGDEVEKREDITSYHVRRFVEKPDRQHAEEYVRDGNYMWNSGMFVWRAGQFLEALREHLPDTYARLEPACASGGWQRLEEAYGALRDISVDYGIMEKVSDVVAVPVDFGWRDVGDWAALYDLMDHDEQGNAFRGPHVSVDTKDSLFVARDKLVAAVGVDNVIVVDTPDALLIMARDRAQDVKKLLDQLKERGETDRL